MWHKVEITVGNPGLSTRAIIQNLPSHCDFKIGHIYCQYFSDKISSVKRTTTESTSVRRQRVPDCDEFCWKRYLTSSLLRWDATQVWGYCGKPERVHSSLWLKLQSPEGKKLVNRVPDSGLPVIPKRFNEQVFTQSPDTDGMWHKIDITVRNTNVSTRANKQNLPSSHNYGIGYIYFLLFSVEFHT